MAVAQERQRRDHVGVALARGQMTDGHECRAIRWRRARRRDVGAEVHDATVARAERGAAPLGARAVGEHEPGVPQRRRDRRATGTRALHVVAVDRHDQRRGTRRAPDRVAGGHRVVGVDHVEGKLPTHAAYRAAQQRRSPRSPARVAPRPWWRQITHVFDAQTIELRRSRLADHGHRAADVSAANRRQRRHRTMQDEHPDVGARVTCRDASGGGSRSHRPGRRRADSTRRRSAPSRYRGIHAGLANARDSGRQLPDAVIPRALPGNGRCGRRA